MFINVFVSIHVINGQSLHVIIDDINKTLRLVQCSPTTLSSTSNKGRKYRDIKKILLQSYH